MNNTFTNVVDKKLILDIFKIGSMSQLETDMINYITKYLSNNNVPFDIDEHGNIWNISNKNRPLLSAHLDTVQDADDFLLAKFAKIEKNILRSYGVLGGDDKAGIYIILHVLKYVPDINFAFFVEEEIGGMNGSRYWVSKHANELDIPWSMVIDRRGARDILCHRHFGSYGTKNFEDALLEVGEKYGFISEMGSISDADNLKDITSTCNISAGYYNPHTKREYVYIPDVENIINFVYECVNTITDKFEPEIDKYGGNSFYTGFDDVDFDFDLNEIDYSVLKEQGVTKYYVQCLGDYYSMKQLDDILIEIVEIQEKQGRYSKSDY